MCPQPDHRLTSVSTHSHPDEFSQVERAILLRLAHDSIQAALEQREIPLQAPNAHLAEPRGVFTTLYYRGVLRGCVGYVLPVAALVRTVAETARGAAFNDSRFAPVTREEAAELRVSLSVLSPPQPIAPEEVEIGRHGLLVSLPPYRGLLLPQVAVEHGWDRTTFLEQTCLKAGLPANAWQQGARLEGFTAEIFADSM